jgi:lipopolysaccharide cholinephosphotransferase
MYQEADNSELRRLQLCELNLLKTFRDVCAKYNLRYYMIGGTMLGAVRHQGFIPWDDDVDIGMPRPDYQKFLKIVRKNLPSYIELLHYKKDEDYLRYFSRLTDRRVTIYNDSNTETLMENAWIDIFPLDGTPNHPLVRKLWFLGLCIMRVKYHFSCFDRMVNLMRPNRPLYQRIIIGFGKRFHPGNKADTKQILRRIEYHLRRYAYDESDYVMNFFGAYVQKEIIPRNWLGEGAEYHFEDITLPGPVSYDIYLKNFFGDYRKPPEDADKDKHTITKIEYRETED